MNARVHGGTDARGAPRWDFSTCANAAGPCPQALAAVQGADATRYPDPEGTEVRAALAALHGVAPARILPAASASEFIQRITAVSGRLWPGAVAVPRHAYGDYAAAALAWGRPLAMQDANEKRVTLRWIADPSSPLGQDAPPAAEHRTGDTPTVLDAVYAPLRLRGLSPWDEGARRTVFVLYSPNKALGLSGVRAAYAVAPAQARFDVQALCDALAAAAPSWPWSAYGEAMLRAWATPAVQAWVVASLGPLAAWTLDLQRQLRARGFALTPSVTPFFLVRPPVPVDPGWLRSQGLAVRDATSFGLPGHWRVSAQPPIAQAALIQAIDKALEGAA